MRLPYLLMRNEGADGQVVPLAQLLRATAAVFWCSRGTLLIHAREFAIGEPADETVLGDFWIPDRSVFLTHTVVGRSACVSARARYQRQAAPDQRRGAYAGFAFFGGGSSCASTPAAGGAGRLKRWSQPFIAPPAP